MDLPADAMSGAWAAMFPFDAGYDQQPTHRQRAQILLEELSRFPAGRLVDLGCGNGWFSLVARQAGWECVAVDARERPWPQVPGITWREGDVRDADLSGFGVVLALGIFYHLDLDSQLGLLKRCAGTPLILDTHLSLDGPEQRGAYRGEVYAEGPSLHAAHGNAESWWPTADSLARMTADAGGYREVVVREPWYLPDRTFITCLP